MYDDVRAVVEPKWSIAVLEALAAESPQNFSAIDDQFETSSDVITERLRLLVSYRLIDRTEYTRRDVRYTITEQGEQFLERLGDLDQTLSEESTEETD